MSCRIMGEMLDAWCGGRTKSGATVAELSDALDEAKLGFQAQSIRHMAGVGNEAGTGTQLPEPRGLFVSSKQ